LALSDPLLAGLENVEVYAVHGERKRGNGPTMPHLAAPDVDPDAGRQDQAGAGALPARSKSYTYPAAALTDSSGKAAYSALFITGNSSEAMRRGTPGSTGDA
jgi:hypothetical protein